MSSDNLSKSEKVFAVKNLFARGWRGGAQQLMAPRPRKVDNISLQKKKTELTKTINVKVENRSQKKKKLAKKKNVKVKIVAW